MNANLQFSESLRVSHEPPQLFVPDALSLFARRARRFAQLAEGHSLGDWLRFLSQLTLAQHEAMQALPALSHSDCTYAHDLPPLDVARWVRDPLWRLEILPALLDRTENAIPPAGKVVVAQLRTSSPDQLESLADQRLLGATTSENNGALFFIGAALQVYWTRMASTLEPARLPRLHGAGFCPCCGSPPCSSRIRSGGNISNLRYLHCGLCNTQWNLVRVKCSVCDSTEGIAYQRLHDRALHVSAESCDSCKSYLKVIHTDKEPDADPVADDLATLALDLLMDKAGYARAGFNPLLLSSAPA